MAKRIEIAKSTIELLLDQSETKVFRLGDLSRVLEQNREAWKLPQNLTTKKFIEFLLEESQLLKVVLKSENYPATETRYIWRKASPYAVGLSLRHHTYLTHSSAVFLHGLTDQIPKTVFVNYEQSAKPQSEGRLSQEGIDRAFSNHQRESKLWFDYEGFRLLLLNGKATDRLEVTMLKSELGESLDVTKLERTLIDIVVRPIYAGGVFQVLEAYKQAKDKFSVNTLLATLKKLQYVYPYHQAIGFYMERAGYQESQWSKLLKIGTKFDFYLSHALPKDKKYDKRWQLFYPSGF